MEPREVLELYDGYEWRHRREAGMLAYLLVNCANAMRANGFDRTEMRDLIEAAEGWLPEEPRHG